MRSLGPVLSFVALGVTVTAAADSARDAFARGDLDAARTLAQAQVDAAPNDIAALLLLARTQIASGDASAALAPLGHAARLAPDDPDVHVQRGLAHGTLAANAHLFAAGRHGKAARAALDRALELDPHHAVALEAGIAYALNAPRLFGGDKTRALQLARHLERIDPSAGRFQQARVLLEMDREDEASALLQSAAQATPLDPRVALELGFIAQREERWRQALDWFARGAAVRTESAETRRARVMCLYQVGRTAVFGERDMQRGIAALQEYIAIAPQWDDAPGIDWAHFRLGQLNELAGQADAARAAYTTARAGTDDRDLRRRAGRRLRSL